jgi:hypothetical protein
MNHNGTVTYHLTGLLLLYLGIENLYSQLLLVAVVNMIQIMTIIIVIISNSIFGRTYYLSKYPIHVRYNLSVLRIISYVCNYTYK